MAARTKKRARAGYMISAVAELYKIHPQTLRLYERVGLLKPSRSPGNTRLYTDEDLAGIEVILNMREKMAEMQQQVEEFIRFVQQELARGLGAAQKQHARDAIVRVSPPRAIRVHK